MSYSLRGPKTLPRVLDCYVERLRVYAKRKSVRNALSSNTRLIKHFGEGSVYDLTPRDPDGFVVKRREEGVRDKTINGDLIILRAALNHALSVGLTTSVPFKVKLLKVPMRRITRIPTAGEIKKPLDCAGGRIYGILLLAVHSAFRTDELLHLQSKDVGWDDCSLRISTRDGIWPSKNHQERKAFVSRELIQWLRDHRTEVTFPEDGGWIFSTRNRTPMTPYNTGRAVKKIFQRAGSYEKGTPTIYLIRHTVACTPLADGTDLETVGDRLGYADISTTSIYLHTTDEREPSSSYLLGLPDLNHACWDPRSLGSRGRSDVDERTQSKMGLAY